MPCLTALVLSLNRRPWLQWSCWSQATVSRACIVIAIVVIVSHVTHSWFKSHRRLPAWAAPLSLPSSVTPCHRIPKYHWISTILQSYSDNDLKKLTNLHTMCSIKRYCKLEFSCKIIVLRMFRIAKNNRKIFQWSYSDYSRDKFSPKFSIAKIFPSRFPGIFTNVFQRKIIPVYIMRPMLTGFRVVFS